MSELADTLRTLRTAADLTLTEAAERVGVGVASLSRYERGLFVPSPGRVEALAVTYNAPARVRKRLVALAKDREAGAKRVVFHRGAVRFQERVRNIEAASQHVATFQPTIIPGILQTEAYMRAITSTAPREVADGVVRYRLERQQLLGDGVHRYTQVLTAGALLWCMGGPDVMAAQLERIDAVSRLDGVRVGVIPPRTPTDVYVLHGFDMYDSDTVIVGTLTATAVLTERPDIRAHAELFAKMEGLAVFDDEARQVLASVAAEYRRN